MTPASPPDAAESDGEWRRGGLLALTATLGMFLGSINSYSIGVFIEPLQKEFGWSRSDIVLTLPLMAVLGMILAPIVGYLVDRFNARTIALPGTLVFCTAIASLSLVSGSLWAWWIAGLVVSAGQVLIKPTVWTAAVVGRFNRDRGLAQAVTLCGIGLAATFTPFIVEWAIRHHGWRMTYVLMGGVGAAIVFPMALLFFFDDRRDRKAPVVRIPWSSLLADLRSSLFIRLVLSAILVTAAINTMTLNFVPLMSSLGMERSSAAAVAGVLGLSSVTGRFFGGFLLDRMDGRVVGAFCYTLPITACAYLLLGPINIPSACVVAAILGLSIGAEFDVMAYLVSRYFGLQRYGVMFGTSVGLVTLASGIGVFVSNWAFDVTGSYRLGLICVMPVLAIAAVLVGTLDRYEVPVRARRVVP